MAECLLTDTDAIPCKTLEWSIRGVKHLVRYKDKDGEVYSTFTQNPVEADEAFMRYLAFLTHDIKSLFDGR
jgi:hypothetical protein